MNSVPQNKKILFVDDEESILDIAREYFLQKGYEVRTAHNGLEALQILKGEKVDCCFTDINMPEMDGLELAENIRIHDNTIPVVVMTGYPSLDNTIQTLKNGVVDFLIKPVNLNQMELCVRRVLRERHLFIDNVLLRKEVESKARLEQLNQELLFKVDELNILNRIMGDFTAISTSSDVFQRVVDLAIEIIHADQSSFYVINDAVKKPFRVTQAKAGSVDAESDHNHNAIEPKALHSSTNPHPDLCQGQLNQLLLEIVSDELPLLVTENAGTQKLSQETRSFMGVPLKIRDKIFGVLTAAITRSAKRFSEKDLYYLSFMTQTAAQAIENLALYENIYENLFATLYGFVKALEARDPYTQQHSTRVTNIALAIGKQMLFSPEDLDVLNVAGRLHDIGKIGIRDDILLKPGRLTKEEYEKIKEHPSMGAEIVGQLGLWDKEREIIRSHHERFDGTGYPNGLGGQDIPLLARVMSVADAYDAMASDRAYRQRMKTERILNILEEGAGTQFDPEIVDVFLALHHKGSIGIDLP